LVSHFARGSISHLGEIRPPRHALYAAEECARGVRRSAKLAECRCHVYSWRMDTRKAAQRWAAVWERGWREHDAAAIAALYAEGAFWQQHPFHDPEPVTWPACSLRRSQPSASLACRSSTAIRPLCPGARTRLADGGTENLAGCRCCTSTTTALSWKNGTSGTRADTHRQAACLTMGFRSSRGYECEIHPGRCAAATSWPRLG
jgi:hypothetical protein